MDSRDFGQLKPHKTEFKEGHGSSICHKNSDITIRSHSQNVKVSPKDIVAESALNCLPSAESLLHSDVAAKKSENIFQQAAAFGRLFNPSNKNASKNLEDAREFEQGDTAKGELNADILNRIVQGKANVEFVGDQESKKQQAEVIARMSNTDFRASVERLLYSMGELGTPPVASEHFEDSLR